MTTCHILFLAYLITFYNMAITLMGTIIAANKGQTWDLNSDLSGFQAHDINCYTIR